MQYQKFLSFIIMYFFFYIMGPTALLLYSARGSWEVGRVYDVWLNIFLAPTRTHTHNPKIMGHHVHNPLKEYHKMRYHTFLAELI